MLLALLEMEYSTAGSTKPQAGGSGSNPTETSSLSHSVGHVVNPAMCGGSGDSSV